MQRSYLLYLSALLLLSPFLSAPKLSKAQDSVRVMNYNVLYYPGSTPERHQYMRQVVHYSKPDLVLTNEIYAEGVPTLLDSSFNRFGVTKYDTARYIDDSPYTSNMLFYNSDRFGLASQDTIQTQLRKIDHYKVFHRDSGLGTVHTDTSFLHLFALHLKASSDPSDEQQRAEEASQLMQYLDGLPDSAQVIAAGDYNIYEPTTEPAWDTLRDPVHPNRLHDPLKTSGDWHNNPQFTDIHTQSVADNGCKGANGAATGGMDDRFDLNLVDEDVLNGDGRYELDSSSYRALGQDGQHLDTCIIADPPENNSVPDSVLTALYNMSDHLPVVMDLHYDDPLSSSLAERGMDDRNARLYPSPGSELLNVDMDRTLKGELRLLDIQGRLLERKEMNGDSRARFNTSDLEPGIYLLEIRDRESGNRRVKKWSKAD